MVYSKVLIIDGYTDEPAGFGVPPYIDVYPRYIAGAVWLQDPSTMVHYLTVDEARKNIQEFLKRASNYDLVVVIAGAIVPGRYLGGEPIRLDELKTWFRILEKPVKILVGAAARWGIGNEGGTIAKLPKEVRENFDAIVTGDPEAYIYELFSEGLEKARTWATLDDVRILGKMAIKGAKIVEQHPNYGYNLIAEIETYRSCSRWLTGGCSFCATKLYGRPLQRPVEDIVREIEALHQMGVRHFRIGRQADFLVYGSPELEVEEWPRPNPEAIKRLLVGARAAAPGLLTLHIDNVNPKTIVLYPAESREVMKLLVQYHTPGDVAALGVESVDPVVVRENNLKTTLEEAFEAVRVINEIGAARGYNGMPELLPGINFVLGLKGETKRTYELNLKLLHAIYEEGLLVRRINVRKVLVLPGTAMASVGTKLVRKHERLIRTFREEVAKLSAKFLRRLVPPGTILKHLYVEGYDSRSGVTFARQAGSYPLVVEIPCRLEQPGVIDVAIYGYSSRSVRGLPVPLDANRSSVSALSKLLGSTAALALAANRPLRSRRDIVGAVGNSQVLEYVNVSGFAC
jgi:radical SAM superfamily enzyme with C-terminal helix-hairpin-helix motif